MSTRAAIAVVVTVACASGMPLPHAVHGQGLATLTTVATALSSAAEAIGKFAESLEQATRAGLRTYDIVAARRAAESLRAISGKAATLPGEQTILVLDPLEQYLTDATEALKRKRPLPDAATRWARATARLDEVVPKVEGLLADVKAARPEFVDPQPYNAFVAALGGRQLVLKELRQLPPPTSSQDVARLQTLHDRYADLLGQLGRANAALEQYILKSTTP